MFSAKSLVEEEGLRFQNHTVLFKSQLCRLERRGPGNLTNPIQPQFLHIQQGIKMLAEGYERNEN